MSKPVCLVMGAGAGPMPALVDQFCPNVHDAPITAACYDPASGTIATADAAGVVAIQRPGEATPQLLFQPGVGVGGALSLVGAVFGHHGLASSGSRSRKGVRASVGQSSA